MLKRTNAEFYSIAARVETELGTPAAIMISSALDSDGTTMVGCRLAEALIGSGYRVAFVDGRAEPATVKPMKSKAIPVQRSDEVASKASRTYASLAVRDLGESFAGSRRDVAGIIGRLRVRYDYVIVDVPSFMNGSLPRLFADVCDGVIVAVTRDRAATAADGDLNSYLDTTDKHTIGIVATSRSAIAKFAANEATNGIRRSVPLSEIFEERSSRVPAVAGSLG